MARKGGVRRGRVSLFTKKSKKKGKISLRGFLKEFNKGDRVALGVEPAVHQGMYNPRFLGKMGTVVSRKGTCYEVKIRDLGKEKVVLVHPIHMKKL